MRMWNQSIKKNIFSNKGETIVETIVSLLILTILVLAVTTTIQTALRITSTSTQNAGKTQEDIINPVILSEYSEIGEARITFEADGIKATHKVKFNKNGGIIAFTPLEEPEEKP